MSRKKTLYIGKRRRLDQLILYVYNIVTSDNFLKLRFIHLNK